MQERDFARRSFGRSVASMPRPALPPTGKHGISPALCAPGSPPRYYNLSYGHPPALGRRDGSDARRPYHFGAASLRRRFLFSARQAVDCISPMRPGLPRLPRAGRYDIALRGESAAGITPPPSSARAYAGKLRKTAKRPKGSALRDFSAYATPYHQGVIPVAAPRLTHPAFYFR